MHKPNIHKATRCAFSATVDEDLGQMITQALHILFFYFYFFFSSFSSFFSYFFYLFSSLSSFSFLLRDRRARSLSLAGPLFGAPGSPQGPGPPDSVRAVLP